MTEEEKYQREKERLRHEKLIESLTAIQEAVIDNQPIRDLTTALNDQKSFILGLMDRETLNGSGQITPSFESLTAKMDEVLVELQKPREYNIKINRDFNGYMSDATFKQIK